MTDVKLLERVKDGLEAGGIRLTEPELNKLFETMVFEIDFILDQNMHIDIAGFGSFSRRKTSSSPITLFKPAEELNDRINQQK